MADLLSGLGNLGGLMKGLTKTNANIFNSVMVIHLSVAVADYGKIKSSVLCEKREHMV